MITSSHIKNHTTTNSNTLNKDIIYNKSNSNLRDPRSTNERIVLSLMRQHGALSKSDIAKHTGLSAQSASVIIKRLKEDGLVSAMATKQGAKGQPKTPFALNEDGAFAIGLKVGRRSYDMTLLDIKGQVRASIHEKIDFPSVDTFLHFVTRAFVVATNKVGQKLVSRIQGIGVAMPSHIWQWADEIDAPADALASWEHFDIERVLSTQFSLPVFVLNDGAAACDAELHFGNKAQYNSFLYIFVGTFLGGGVVLNNTLITGKSGNAGAIGSLPFVNIGNDAQLISGASLYVLANMLKESGDNAEHIFENTSNWSCNEDVLTNWCLKASEGIAFAAHCAMSLLDVEGIIIDGAMPAAVKSRIVEETQKALLKQDTRGLIHSELALGKVGPKAQSIGSAHLPLSANYF